jgi:transcriptional regulator with XRE-family HTH domain
MDKSLTRPEYRLLLTELRKARKEAGLNQTELGARLGETQSFISKVERGERRLDLVELDAFCKALGVSLEDFTSRFSRAIRGIQRKRK